MDKGTFVFTSYNKVMESSHEKFFHALSMKKDPDNIRYKDDELQQYIKKYVKGWEATALEELNGLSPAQYIEGIDDFGTLISLFKQGSAICDDSLPEIYADRFIQFGEEAIGSLIGFATDSSLIEGTEDESMIALNAVRLLGSLKTQEAVDVLLEVLQKVDPENALFQETVKDALINTGMPATAKIMQLLNADGVSADTQQYLMIALAHIGRHNKDNAIYRSLKDAFVKMDDKVIGAMCLGDYGDSRAIPFLRGFIEKNLHNIDRMVLLDIKAVINQLGGNADDLLPR